MQAKESEYKNIEFVTLSDLEGIVIDWKKGQPATFTDTITIGAGSHLEVRQIVNDNKFGDFGIVSPIKDRKKLLRVEYKELIDIINNQLRFTELTAIVEQLVNGKEEE